MTLLSFYFRGGGGGGMMQFYFVHFVRGIVDGAFMCTMYLATIDSITFILLAGFTAVQEHALR